jgi:catalase
MVDVGTKYFNSNLRRPYSLPLIQSPEILRKQKNSASALTTASGRPVDGNQNPRTAGQRRPVLVEDRWLVEPMARSHCERITDAVRS